MGSPTEALVKGPLRSFWSSVLISGRWWPWGFPRTVLFYGRTFLVALFPDPPKYSVYSLIPIINPSLLKPAGVDPVCN